MFKNKLVITAMVAITAIHSLSSAFCDNSFVMPRYRFYVHLTPRIATLNRLQTKRGLIEYNVIQEKDKNYLEVIVRGIAKPEIMPKEIVKKDNKISIATEQGSFSIEQNDNNNVILRAEYNATVDQSGIKRSSQGQEQRVKSLPGKIKFNEVRDFAVTSMKKATTDAVIMLRLPFEIQPQATQESDKIEDNEPVTKVSVYSFQTNAPIEQPAVAATASLKK